MNDPVRKGEQPDEPLRIAIEQGTPDLAVVQLAGDLDLLTAPLLHERLWPLLTQRDRTVLIDLSGVAFLGSAGLSELAAASDTAGRHGTVILLVANSRAVLRPLEVTGLHTLFPIFDSVESALHER
jgi:anti-sigma B factor antagonist